MYIIQPHGTNWQLPAYKRGDLFIYLPNTFDFVHYIFLKNGAAVNIGLL